MAREALVATRDLQESIKVICHHRTKKELCMVKAKFYIEHEDKAKRDVADMKEGIDEVNYKYGIDVVDTMLGIRERYKYSIMETYLRGL